MIDFHCDNCEFLQDKSNDNIIDGYCKKYNQSLTFYDWFEKCDKCLIETLQSENASLRERLAHSLELPYMEQAVSQYGTEDTVLYYMENGKLQQECFNNKFPEQLQAKLAELKGEKE